MGLLRTITRNAFSNAAGFVVNAVVTLLLTPFVIDTLGKPAYGIWVLFVAFTGYYGLMDLGIRSAVGQYVTRYWAKGDIDGVSRTMSTAFGLTSLIGLVLLLATGVLMWLAPLVFDMESVDIGTARLVLLIMAGGVAINFPLAIFQSATYARQRLDIANAIGIASRLISAGLYVWVLLEGWGLLGIAIVTTAVTLGSNLFRVWIAYGMLPGLHVRFALFDRGSVRELGHFGFYNALINASDQIVLQSDTIVLGLFMTSVAITHYTVGALPITFFLAIINAIAWTLTPYATSCDAKGDYEALRRLWVTGSRLILIVAALIAAGLVVMGRDFIALWQGEQFVSGDEYHSSATVLAVLAIAALARCGMTIGKQILFGIRAVGPLARLSIIEAALNLLLSVILIQWFGLLGVALGTLFSMMTTQLWLQPRVVARHLKLPVREFVLRVPWGGLITFLTMVTIDALLSPYLQVADWGTFVLKAFLLAVPSLAIGLLFGTSRVEKIKVLERGWLRRNGRNGQ